MPSESSARLRRCGRGRSAHPGPLRGRRSPVGLSLKALSGSLLKQLKSSSSSSLCQLLLGKVPRRPSSLRWLGSLARRRSRCLEELAGRRLPRVQASLEASQGLPPRRALWRLPRAGQPQEGDPLLGVAAAP